MCHVRLCVLMTRTVLGFMMQALRFYMLMHCFDYLVLRCYKSATIIIACTVVQAVVKASGQSRPNGNGHNSRMVSSQNVAQQSSWSLPTLSDVERRRLWKSRVAAQAAIFWKKRQAHVCLIIMLRLMLSLHQWRVLMINKSYNISVPIGSISVHDRSQTDIHVIAVFRFCAWNLNICRFKVVAFITKRKLNLILFYLMYIDVLIAYQYCCASFWSE